MTTELETELARALGGEVRFDAYTRHLYSTDASMYAIEPIGVAFPRDRDDVAAAVEIAGRFGAPVLPRGGGTSLGGQTVGQAIVLDFSRHMHGIVAIDPEAGTARVQPGVVQDDLNRAAAAYGLFFAPDTSTANRATLGGMIGNNSCGARSARYGMTIDHVESLNVVLADGSAASLGPVEPEEIAARARPSTLEGRLYREIPALMTKRAEVIRRDMPPHWRRSGGYRLERLLPDTDGGEDPTGDPPAGPSGAGRQRAFNLAKLLVGSEGTLAVTVEATVRLVPRPPAVAALVGHFATLGDAIRASRTAMACGATAVELMDRLIIDLARRSPVHRHLANSLTGDPGALLWVEFYGDSTAEASVAMERLRESWTRAGEGYAHVPAPTPADQTAFRALRRAGQGLLLAAGTERERSLAFVEDTAVDPAHLTEYVDRFSGILKDHGLRAGFYGHASAGCLHIRPYLDLRRPGDVQKMRTVAEAVCELVREFGGMNSSEHGDGLVRSEFNRRIFGPELYEAMREVKRIFDPDGRLNPGKKVDSPRLTEHLREPALRPVAPLTTHFPFPFEDGMRGAANRCMRIGACRKSPEAGGTMCPSYMATREEEHSTRGRANALVKALSTPDPGSALGDHRLHEVLDLCLECKACQTECPLSVDMAAMKSETLAHYYRHHGVPRRARIFGHVRTLNRLGSAFAPLSNVPAASASLRNVLERTLGIDRRRPLPRFRRDTLQRWFARRRANGAATPVSSHTRTPPRRQLIFLADSFTSYTEPEIGRAAIELLEEAGWAVRLVDGVCCGRSLISKGLLDQAKARHAELVKRLGAPARAGIPIVGCEPSCILTLRDEVPALSGESEEALAIARQARLADELLADAVAEGALAPDPDSSLADRRILFHPHCHQKAGGAVAGSVSLLAAIPGAQVDVLDVGCCGMAGSFGFETEHYDLSMKIGGLRLFPAVEQAGPEAVVAATGVSCRQQIAHGTGRAVSHPIVLLREAFRRPTAAPEPVPSAIG